TITERGGTRAEEGKLNMSPVEVLVNLWRHECERVFCDKLTTNKDKEFFEKYLSGLVGEVFGEEL
ncbi:unnamed protein product, partial [Hapterophycus canaliculatus]